MGYTVLARKYRPQKFADLVGQEHVTRTIGNAIASGRVAHAFLFTGARGVGKTSTARLLAKALNCEQGPTNLSCNECAPCLEITQGTDMDVLEIDGASNNSVEDVRRLQESLPYRPTRDRFKVVIVDEVHMLSTGAFNAFLKTLEEPPEHVKFIFATTEVHKVPITIRSRCQRHDFRLIPQTVVATHVREILASEQVQADEEAINMVAREAAGSMRDALTVLDQLLAFCGDGLTGAAVASALGIAGREQIHTTAEALLEGDPKACLQAVHSLSEQGMDVLHFSRQLLQFIRDLIVLKVIGEEGGLTELTPDERSEALTIIEKHESAELERAFFGLSELVDTLALSGSPHMCLEMGLVRLADRPRLRPLSELVAKLDAAMGGDGGSGGGGGGGSPGSGAGSGGGYAAGGRGGADRGGQRQPARSGGGSPRASANYTAGQSSPKPAVARSENPTHAGRFQPPTPARLAAVPAIPAAPMSLDADMHATPSVGGGFRGRPHGTQAAAAAQAAAAIAHSVPDSPPEARQQQARQRPVTPAQVQQRTAKQQASMAKITALAEAAQRARSRLEQAPAEDDAPEEQADAPTATTHPAAQLRSNMHPQWPEFVAKVHEEQPALGAILQHGVACTLTAARIEIAFPSNSFFGRQAQAPAALAVLKRVAATILGGEPELGIRTGGAPDGSATLAQLDEAERREAKERAREAALNHPLVLQAMEIFPESRERVEVQIQMD